ncbi:glycosyltransferase family 4 protein [soil metagenome]
MSKRHFVEKYEAAFDLPVSDTRFMKIVRIIARLNVGGPARHVVWLTKALNNSEFETILIAGRVPDGEENMEYFAEENGVAPVYIEEMSRELSPKDIVSLWKVYRRICIEKPDIIHTHTAKAGTVGRLAGFLYRWLNWKNVQLVHTFHGHVFHSYYGNLKTKIFLLIEKFLARFATDKIIVITRQQFEEINKKFGVGRENQFEIIPLGIDLEKFSETEKKKENLKSEIGAEENEILVGFVGRFTEIKNIPLFLEAAKIYSERRNENSPNLKFILVGDGHLRPELEKQVEELQINENVKFLGNRNDADVFYAGLDIIALTSLNEGTPLSLIEAMANGKPVISTAVGGVPDLLGELKAEKEGFNLCDRGAAVSSENAEGIYNGLVFLAEDANLRQELGEKGKAFVLANYAKERLVSDIENLYRKMKLK